jgi:outer membrane protein assembly factor BamD (BamD/ComL family)
MSATAADEMAATREMVERLAALELKIKPTRPRAPEPLDGGGTPPKPCDASAAQTVPAPAAAPAGLADPALNDRIVALLEEIREVSLMSDEQRQVRLRHYLESRRRSTLDQVFLSFRAGRWAIADQLLTSLESQFASDPAVKQARGEFHRQRTAAETEAFLQTEQRVRDLAHLSSWDLAIATATEFVNNFPGNVEGRHLLTQVCRDLDAFRDAAFQRMYEQVQANVDRRQWRTALVDAKQLLEEFPNHSRANRIRQQFKTISANAEIEERQEHEVRIQLLVTNRRFAEAVELAEEVVRRFPDSPQADALEERLPQLRELAEHGDGNGV